MLALVRAVHFLSLMTIFGSDSLRLLFRTHFPEAVEPGLPRSFPTWCAIVAFLSALLWLALVAAQLSARNAVDLDAIWRVAQSTLFGRVALARLAFLGALLAAMQLSPSAMLRSALSGAALATIALTSHAAAAGDAHSIIARSCIDAVHLLAAGFWLGGLIRLVPRIVRNRKHAQAILPALRAFSGAGMIAVSLLVIAGALNGYLILFSAHRMWSSTYVGLLSFKIVLASVMIAIAITNRVHAVPAIARNEADGPETVMIGAVAELVLGIAIVAIVALLGTLAPLRA